MDDPTSSRKKEAWTFALAIVSVIAVGIVIAGLLQPPPEPELTTAPPSSSTVEPEPTAPVVERNVVQEPVDPTVDIPGCDTVEEPEVGVLGGVASFGEPSYDNPEFPWFSGPKATAMSSAVMQLLPAGAEIEFASPARSLIFQPITDFGDSEAHVDGHTSASGSVVNGDSRGSVYIVVQESSVPIPPCVAGYLDERRTLADGTVVDVHDTWRDVDGVRTLRRSAHGYATDGSWIRATATDSVGAMQQENSGTIPLTVDDLVRIVSDTRLRAGTAVPPGTPAPPEGCRSAVETSGPAVTREQAVRLDSVLATIDLGGPKLNPLQLSEYSDDTLCTGITDVKPNAGLDISIAAGQPLPEPQHPDPHSGGQKTLRTLADGTVVQTELSYFSGRSVTESEESTMTVSNSVVVTRPAGTQITVTSSAGTPEQARPLSVLESIALTPGLEL